MKKTHAFSLFELLVVLAIIAVLAGVASAALLQARESSKSAQCLGQMRELASAIHLWAADRGGELPRSSHSAFNNRSHGWQREILPYLGAPDSKLNEALEQKHFRCPADTKAEGTSYGLNVFFELDPEFDDYEGAPVTWRRTMLIPSPANTILLAEMKSSSSADHVMAHFWSKDTKDTEVAIDRHNDRSNYVFADGHAALLPVEDIYDSGRGVNCWNPSLAGEAQDACR